MPEHAIALYSRKRVGEVALLAAIGVSFYLCWRLAEPFLTAITWALALAVVGFPLQRLLEARLKPGLAAAITLVIVTLVLVGPCVLLLQSLLDEAGSGIALLRQNLN